MMDNNKIEEAKDSIFNKHFLKNSEGDDMYRPYIRTCIFRLSD